MGACFSLVGSDEFILIYKLFFFFLLQKAESGPKFICYIDSLPFSNLSSRTSPLIKLAPKKLLANTKYEFEVSVYKGSRKTSAKTVIEVKEGDPPEVRKNNKLQFV